MSLVTLEKIMKRPIVAQDALSPDRWKVVEEQLGTGLPEDYKRFLEAFGIGTINGFLVVLAPLSSNQHVDLLKRCRSELEAYETSKREFPQYYCDDVYPTPGGILPFAVTDNGEVLYWRTVGSPEQWTVTVYESRGPKKFDFDGGMTEFLVAILTGEIECDVLPRGFSKSPPVFKPIKLPCEPARRIVEGLLL
jgi:hypothetical protein